MKKSIDGEGEAGVASHVPPSWKGLLAKSNSRSRRRWGCLTRDLSLPPIGAVPSATVPLFSAGRCKHAVQVQLTRCIRYSCVHRFGTGVTVRSYAPRTRPNRRARSYPKSGRSSRSALL